MFKKYKVVFFPIESSSREVKSRRHLSKLLSESDDRLLVIVIEQQLLRVVSFFFGNAVFFGKHFFSKPMHADRSYYDRIKRRGGVIVYLHEEGVFIGNSRTWEMNLINTMKPSIFGSDDFLLVWSEWQKSFFESNFSLKCRILVSGHPRFDLYRNTAVEYKEYDVLVNTSFSYSNSGQGLKFIFSGKNPSYDIVNKPDFIFSNYFSQRAAQSWMETTIYELATAFPQKSIVIRPHPSESESYYQDLFETIENVNVYSNEPIEDALAKSVMLIQLGCTTSIESYIAKIPTYTNKNLGKSRALIANDLSQDLASFIPKDFRDLERFREIPESVIKQHANSTLANLDGTFKSTEIVLDTIRLASNARLSMRKIHVVIILLVSLLTYWLLYWPLKLIYYLFCGRLSEVKDFRRRFNSKKDGSASFYITRYIELFHQ